ncbi:hypothetical protein [Microbacterium sp. cf332]|uniref:hypothetical protein n=1 Tax=Microbacterium sp. cf332 TaxID=1761804 RepID=UPI00115FE31A|nr:hypothetical protein [Microbacterium sp. cf332]
MSTQQLHRTATLIPLGVDRWRVVEADGRVRGLIERAGAPTGARFRALRYHLASRSFRGIGEFWSLAEAAETLRLSR